jgi:predicted metalloprotease
VTFSTRSRRAGAVALVAVVAMAGCGGDDSESRRDRIRIDREETTTTAEVAEGLDLEDIPVEDQDDAIIEATITDVEAFWTDEFPRVYGDEFEPVSGGFFPYGPNRELPDCGGQVSYEEIAQNAFYCPPGDLIAWDTDNLTNDLLAEFGPYTLAIVMAHEYGHAIQARIPVTGVRTIVTEQQADCFAGAFTKFVADGDAENLSIDVDDLDSSIAGFIFIRDQVGTPSDDPSAHGSGFDRIGAFQDGFLNGTEACAEYPDIFQRGGTTVIDIPLDPTDPNQGDAPLVASAPDEATIFDLTLGSLEIFFDTDVSVALDITWEPLLQDDQIVAFDPDDPDTLPECPGTDITAADVAGIAFSCFGDPDDPDDDYVAFDADLAAQLHGGIGDFAVASLLAKQYAFVAQVLAGNLEDDQDSNLQADCITGAYTGAVAAATLSGEGYPFNPDDPTDPQSVLTLSAGDLDEAIQAFLTLGEDADPDISGTPFQRVTSFRDGFFNGMDACATYLDGGAPDADELITPDD